MPTGIPPVKRRDPVQDFIFLRRQRVAFHLPI
jgi:hypothetical protein